MAHEDMTVDDVLDLVDELRPVTTQAGKTSDLGLGFVLYDAFKVRGSYDDYGGGSWGFGIILGGRRFGVYCLWATPGALRYSGRSASSAQGHRPVRAVEVGVRVP